MTIKELVDLPTCSRIIICVTELGMSGDIELIKVGNKFIETSTQNIYNPQNIINSEIIEVMYPKDYYKMNIILDKTEREYLKQFLMPFRKKVRYICKRYEFNKRASLYIALEDDESFYLPSFECDSMYKGMKINKNYTLKDLNIF